MNGRDSFIKRTNQIRECQPSIRDDALDLVEFRQMRRVHGLIAEHTVDAKQLCRAEAVVVVAFLRRFATASCREFVKHVRGGRGRVRAEEELVRLGVGPGRAVPDRAKAAVLVNPGDPLIIVTRGRECPDRVREVKSVLHFACRVLLGNEERVETPKAGFDERGRWHLGEAAHESVRARVWRLGADRPHLEKNVAHLLPHLEQRVQRASVGIYAFCFKVVFFELRRLPGATEGDEVVSDEKARKARTRLACPR